MNQQQRFIEVSRQARQFIHAIESTGGLVLNSDGVLAPAADPTWTDMASIYVAMCRAYGRDVEMPQAYDNNDDPAFHRELR